LDLETGKGKQGSKGIGRGRKDIEDLRKGTEIKTKEKVKKQAQKKEGNT
jgi:hypothetical protein